jgi:pimeloyl-ACP methyl ester carboxylesterase
VIGRTIFYWEAGDPTAPTILLLHGLPTSSRMFRDLIPALADDFHFVAPDYVGFGHSDAPPHDAFAYPHAEASAPLNVGLGRITASHFSASGR